MGTWNCLPLLLLALPSVLSRAYTNEDSLMYPYGEAYGDITTPEDDDGGTDSIALTHSVTFFSETYGSLHVNNNGAISFNGPVTAYTPDGFPIPEFWMICPYWADVDNECGGDIFFRQTTEEELMQRLSKDVNEVFQGLKFKSQWAFIVTWDKVAYHGTESNKTNTFQAVIAVDYHRTVVIFNYLDIQWTTGTASGGDALTGLGGITAQAGFNAGLKYFNIPLSRTPHIVNIKSSSNIGRPGRWIFMVHDFQVPGGCIHQDSFLNFGQVMWNDDSCSHKCSCKHNGKVQCDAKPCDEGLVCLPSGRHFMCQINEEDC
ncbi:alpha-tectorin-like [Engystomops pustulosus]|uniref:alpha-tectorin-like n=1 Tax=Engystomops pustulosus TaxID=76066 RepID=UPI003AFAE575